jgi:hypothetical protein
MANLVGPVTGANQRHGYLKWVRVGEAKNVLLGMLLAPYASSHQQPVSKNNRAFAHVRCDDVCQCSTVSPGRHGGFPSNSSAMNLGAKL